MRHKVIIAWMFDMFLLICWYVASRINLSTYQPINDYSCKALPERLLEWWNLYEKRFSTICKNTLFFAITIIEIIVFNMPEKRRISYKFFCVHFPQLSPTFGNFPIFTDIYPYFRQRAAGGALLPRLFSVWRISLVPSLFLSARKNEGTRKEELENSQRTKDVN